MVLKATKKSLALIPDFKKVVVGISGGSDSVALAHILIQLGYKVILAHLNHNLRAEDSDLDAEFVDKLSKEWGVPCIINKADISKQGNLENNARKARYGFLESVRLRYKAKYIAVAHHEDDQIETVLLHMLRGAGLKGMRGMQFVSGPVIRPLLSSSKQDVTDYLKKNRLSYCIDETNLDVTFQRNKIRHEVIPVLQKKNPNFKEELLKMAEAAQKEWKMVHEKAVKWIHKNVTTYAFSRNEFLNLPDAVQSEVLFLLEGYYNVYRHPIEQVKTLINSGETGKRSKLGRFTFEVSYDDIHFYKNKVTIEPLKKSQVTNRLLEWGKWRIRNSGSSPLFVRSWKPGDRFEPHGMKGTKKLQDFFVDQKIPRNERQLIPIIVNEADDILGIGHFRLARRGLHLKQCLEITKIK